MFLLSLSFPLLPSNSSSPFYNALTCQSIQQSRYHRRRVQRLLFKELTRKLLEGSQVSTVLRESKHLYPKANTEVLPGDAAERVMTGPLANVPMSEPALKHLRNPMDPFSQHIRSHPKYVYVVDNSLSLLSQLSVFPAVFLPSFSIDKPYITLSLSPLR